jgi:predicted O-methyltransferase YrrM
MFRDMPQSVEATQGHLRALEAWRKAQGAERARLLRQIPPETGKLLAILLANCPPGDAVEVGSGAGYSGLWLALACRETRRTLTTFELDPAKAEQIGRAHV